MLLLKLEQMNECAAEAMRDFLGLENFVLRESNTADDKEYADLYAAFRREITLPTEYLDRMYSSRLAQRFYAADEIAAFRRKWSVVRIAESG